MNSNSLIPSLSTRIQQITDEFSQAIGWNSPCLVLAVYRSQYIKDQVARSIRQFAEENGQSVKEYWVTKADNDVLLSLKELTTQAGILHYIAGLQWGGGRQGSNAFRALNMHREYLVEYAMRCIFWITPSELKKVTRFSPDFWAFRHKVVDFPDLPSPDHIMGWGSRETNWAEEIGRHQGSLKKSPNDLTSRKELAELFALLGCYEEAIQQYKIIIRLADDKSDLLLSLAKVYESVGVEHLARQAQRQARRLRINDHPGS